MDSVAELRNMALSFFFQAEDGIRDLYVTGVQTCALPILTVGGGDDDDAFDLAAEEIACRFGLGGGGFVGGGDKDGVGVLLGDLADGVRAGGEEGIVEIGDDHADRARAMAAKRA